jgi:DNA-binding PadR family transcriptional regulator
LAYQSKVGSQVEIADSFQAFFRIRGVAIHYLHLNSGLNRLLFKDFTPDRNLDGARLEAIASPVILLWPFHGVGIADGIGRLSRSVFVVGPGSLFPALHRRAEKGWIEGEWGELENRRRARSYALTRSGRAQLAREKRTWRKVLTAMNQVLAEGT